MVSKVVYDDTFKTQQNTFDLGLDVGDRESYSNLVKLLY